MIFCVGWGLKILQFWFKKVWKSEVGGMQRTELDAKRLAWKGILDRNRGPGDPGPLGRRSVEGG